MLRPPQRFVPTLLRSNRPFRRYWVRQTIFCGVGLLLTATAVTALGLAVVICFAAVVHP